MIVATLGTLFGIAALTYALISPVRLVDLKSPDAPIGAEEELVVVTYNVNFATGRNRFPAASLYGSEVSALRAQNADIIVLQETNLFWQRMLGETLLDRFPHQYWREPTAPYAASGAAILSRFPLSPLEASPSPLGWFESISAIATTPHGDVRIAGVHLEPAVGVRPLLSATSHHRQEMLAHIDAFDLANRDLPTIIAGDFNEERAGATRLLSTLGFENAVRRFATNDVTWKWWPLKLQLDHIFANDALEALSARVEVAGTSDHYPVRAAFRFRTNA